MSLSREHFERLALEHLDAVDRFARSLTRHSAESDDLVQETFLRALRSAESFDLRSFGMKPWLLRILHNLFLSRATREKKQPKAVDDEQLHTSPANSTVQPLSAEEQSWEANETLARAMRQLSPDLRNTMLLWALDELTYQEIADVMEVPVGTIMSRLHRARQRLRELLEGVAPNK